MSVRIQLDNATFSYTNLDFVSGKVVVYLQNEASFSAIVVKLEGESRSRLAGVRPQQTPNSQPSKEKTELEVHKLLYKVVTVFPSPELQRQAGSSSSFTLPPGQWEYPFKFKIPFNNSCSNLNSSATNVNFAGLKLEVARDTNSHVKKTLPPSLSGFPGMAEIRYYVKVTAVKPKFYQENVRAFHDFNFLPIEPPRPAPSVRQETFARRNNQFAQSHQPAPKKSPFKMSSSRSEVDTGPGPEPPAFVVDARLPSPAILTINEPLPLRILVRKTSQSSEILFLSTLVIELFGFTKVRAHELIRTEAGSWILTSQANMNVPLGSSSDPFDKELKVPKQYFNQVRLPTSVCPSFETCNISRSYEIEIRVGLSHGVVGSLKPEVVVLPLRLPIQVFSGIAPPASLLDAMGTPHQSEVQSPLGVPPSSYVDAPSQLSTPISSNDFPPQTGTPSHSARQPEYVDAPPTYEEALAEDIAPVDGPRVNYQPPPSPRPPMPPRPSIVTGSEKPGGVQRMPSERLFPDSTGSTGSATTYSGDRQPSYHRILDPDQDLVSTPIQSHGEISSAGPTGDREASMR